MVLVGPLADAPHGESVVPELIAFAIRALGVRDDPGAGRARLESGVSDADA
ncbi:hypothetical protein [Nocardia abscessus]|uniref:hypothetical protein n=1 Tax=Nocardia abscessus TaxID=120957 RepID=UPI002454E259|nr:hypothetical protein [Nocardia abscessus]